MLFVYVSLILALFIGLLLEKLPLGTGTSVVGGVLQAWSVVWLIAIGLGHFFLYTVGGAS